MHWDEELLRWLNEGAAYAPLYAMSALLSSRLMIPLVCGPVAFVLLRGRQYRAALTIVAAMGLADVITARVLKPAFARERPCRTLENLEVLHCGRGQSFPSGHATVAFALLATAAPAVRRGWWWLTPVATGVGASRVVLGVHYPSDVLAGAAVGFGIGAAVRFAAALKRPKCLRASCRECSTDGDRPGPESP